MAARVPKIPFSDSDAQIARARGAQHDGKVAVRALERARALEDTREQPLVPGAQPRDGRAGNRPRLGRGRVIARAVVAIPRARTAERREQRIAVLAETRADRAGRGEARLDARAFARRESRGGGRARKSLEQARTGRARAWCGALPEVQREIRSK